MRPVERDLLNNTQAWFALKKNTKNKQHFKERKKIMKAKIFNILEIAACTFVAAEICFIFFSLLN